MKNSSNFKLSKENTVKKKKKKKALPTSSCMVTTRFFTLFHRGGDNSCDSLFASLDNEIFQERVYS